VAAAFLSQDPTLCAEIREGIDIHGRNQERFKLPERVIAKIFVFRLLYGGNEFSYANDPEFNWVSSSPKYWRRIIDEFYNKYTGISRWHVGLVDIAQRTGGWCSPTGRTYKYEPYKDRRGQWTWPRTKILNYPVQGLGADLMSIARVSAYRRLRDRVLFCNTVHDSIIVDSPNNIVYTICDELERVFVDIPRNFEKVFGVPFNLPMKGEVKYGMNWKDLQKYEHQH
jgi:DNA polymerase I-like protein with 3'-5' exonuclease and polymerase domains